MKTITLPYDKECVELEIDERYIEATLLSEACIYKTDTDGEMIVEEALSNPVGCGRIEELSSGKKNIVIITDDHTKPTPNSIILPAILRRVRQQSRDVNVTILVATGSHRTTEYEELLKNLGGGIIRHERVIVHNSRERDDMCSIGAPLNGADIEVNKLLLEADLLIAVGHIAPHILSGFSGGGGSVLPGAASLRCVIESQCACFSNDANTYAGLLEDNPLQSIASEAAKRAGLRFILNVALNKDKEIIKAFAGDFNEAYINGCEFVGAVSSVGEVPADIVIASNGGYPLDQNVYQAVKGIAAASACCKEGGVIIQVAACIDGHGGEHFYNAFKCAEDPKDVINKLTDADYIKSADGYWAALTLARILEKHKVIMVAEENIRTVVTDMFMDYAPSPEEALSLARNHMGEEASITIIPNGASVIVKPLEK